MLALRFFSVVVGDFIAGYCIRSQGVDPHQFGHPVGFFRGARVSAFRSRAAHVLRLTQRSAHSALSLHRLWKLSTLKRRAHALLTAVSLITALPHRAKDDSWSRMLQWHGSSAVSHGLHTLTNAMHKCPHCSFARARSMCHGVHHHASILLQRAPACLLARGCFLTQPNPQPSKNVL